MTKKIYPEILQRMSINSNFIHTYIFINPRSRMIQDAKTVSDEMEKGAKKN